MNHIRTLFVVCLGLLTMVGHAQQVPKVYYYTIDDDISKSAQRKTKKAVEEAQAMKADYLLLELNTYGGELAVADEIRTMLMNAPMPTMVFINNNAASAGALISIACDSIYMAPGSSFGAASVVNAQGEIMPDKYQSFMRSLMRATAETNGRDPAVAEAMVDLDMEVPGISEKGKVLTFTTEEAIQHHYCEGEAEDREAVLQAAGLNQGEWIEQKLNGVDRLINFLINPIVSSILIMCIIGGLYFEFQSPGLGLPIIISLIAALLYFAPHYLEGLAAHWEILLFFVGLILLILEIFVIPGFGVAGISGLVLIFASLILTMIFNVGFKFSFNPDFDAAVQLGKNTVIVVLSVTVGFFLSLWLSKKLITAETRFGTIALKTRLDNDHNFIAPDMRMQQYVGQTGTAATFMRPVGKINIEGELLDATSEYGLIEKGDSIVATKFENAQLYVRKTDQS